MNASTIVERALELVDEARAAAQQERVTHAAWCALLERVVHIEAALARIESLLTVLAIKEPTS